MSKPLTLTLKEPPGNTRTHTHTPMFPTAICKPQTSLVWLVLAPVLDSLPREGTRGTPRGTHRAQTVARNGLTPSRFPCSTHQWADHE